MPRISFFYGITIWMYWNEGVHARPHFHARYAGHAASIDLDGEVISPSSRFPNMVAVEQLVDVTAVEVVGDYRLRLTFEDGTVGDVDFGDREWRGVFERLRDPAYFARVAVNAEAGTITWPDGLDMAPEPLYAEARRHPAPQAGTAT